MSVRATGHPRRFRADVTVNGALTSSDISLAKSNWARRFRQR